MSNWTTVTGILYVKDCDFCLKTGAQVLEKFVNENKYLLPKGTEDTLNINVIQDRTVTGAVLNEEYKRYEYGNAVITIFGSLRDMEVEEAARGFKKFARQLRKKHGIDMGCYNARDNFNTVTIRIINNKFENLSSDNGWYEDLSAEEIRALEPFPF